MEETWKPVVGREGTHEVSDLGRVRLKETGELIWIGSMAGYSAVFGRYVHHLVMEAFVGPRAPGIEVRHKDRDIRNPALSNLEYGTSSDNKYDQVRDGTHPEARRTHCDRGHEYTPENTKVEYKDDGSVKARWCIKCNAERQREFVARRKLTRDKICTEPDCDNIQIARGWCSTHYARWHRKQKAEKAAQDSRAAELINKLVRCLST